MAKQKTIKQRAAAIIANTKRCDAETREAISNSLKRDRAADLAEMVKRAEAGEEIWDLARERAKCEQAAAQVVALFANASVPDFITAAVMDAIGAASKIQRIGTWDNEKEDFSMPALADLFAVSKMLSLDKQESSTEALASHIGAILEHPETPDALYNDIAERISDFSSAVDFHTPEMIKRSLVAYAGRESRRKGGKS
jgi:hypothetical protein